MKGISSKTVFLLALGSGKRRSEIHVWLYKNIRHQENWSQVSFYPSPSFLSKNQLARDGPASVAPVVIPALAPTLDKSLSEDKSLCPVRALRYYLDRTKDLRKGKDLVFVSFRKGFQKDIVPATISSWIKETVLLCYHLSDEAAQNLHQVRAQDDLFLNMSEGSTTALTLLDLSAAFDTIDHSILFHRLYECYGINGLALSWFKSYLSDRTQSVKVGSVLSHPMDLKFGVPQGSVHSFSPCTQIHSVQLFDLTGVSNTTFTQMTLSYTLPFHHQISVSQWQL